MNKSVFLFVLFLNSKSETVLYSIKFILQGEILIKSSSFLASFIESLIFLEVCIHMLF